MKNQKNTAEVVLSTNDQSHPAQLAAREAAEFIAEATGVQHHDVALTLGSGWGEAASLLGETTHQISAEIIPGFHSSQVAGHAGTVSSVLTSTGKRALVIGARTHFYEGRGVDAVVHGVRTAAATGASTMVLTNGCGALNPDYAPGMPVLISDHINATAVSPLRGAHFVDLTDVYSPRLRELAREIDSSLLEGVYYQTPGPHYETPAEIRMMRTMGADLVGMSTALEAIAARAAGMEVLGMSLVTNMAAGIQKTALNHEEVLQAGQDAAPRISRLLAEIIHKI